MIYAPPRSRSNTTTSETRVPPLVVGDSTSLTIEPKADSWIEYAFYRIKEAYALEDNWDLEGAVKVQAQSAERAEAVAVQLMTHEVSRPFVVPSQEGGICFEWLTPTTEVSIEVDGEVITACVMDRESRAERVGALEEMWEFVYEALKPAS